jgi:L-malate glycosyltransferase
VKVLLVASWWPTPEEPAGGIFIKDQARLLTREHDVLVIAPDAQRWNRFPRWRLTSPPTIREDAYRLARPVVLTPLPRHPRSSVPAFARVVRGAFDQAQRTWGRPDVIHAHTSIPGGYAAARLARDTRIPMVLTEHSWPATLRLEEAAQGRFARAAMAGAAVRLAVSEPLAAAYRDLTGLAVEVLANVVDFDFFSPDPKAAEPRDDNVQFLLIGRLVPQTKGADVAIEAAAMLPGTTNWRLWIVGDGPERAALERRSADLGVSDRVTFLGYVQRPALRDLLARTDYLVAPSRWETFGLAAAEAMAMGVPVLGSNTGGLAAMVSPSTGLLVEHGEPGSLAGAMRRAISGELTFDAGQIRSSVQHRFGADTFLRGIRRVYERAIGARDEDEEV